MNKVNFVYWITGLSGSGKSTIARYFFDLLNNKGQNVIIIDGDDMRRIIGGGYTKDKRIIQAKKYSEMCKLFSSQGMIVIAAVGALIHEIQEWNRLNITNYIEVYLNVPYEELRKRNKKKTLFRF